MRSVWFIWVLLPTFCVGQQNLVPNPSFEAFTHCPSTGNQLHFAEPWQNSGPPCSPDYFNACCPPTFYPPDHYVHTKGVPENGVGYQHARSGEAYAGFYAYSANANNGREFIQVQLTQPVIAGVRYEVVFHVSLADKFKYAVSSLGAHFSDTLIVRDSYMIWDLNLTPQVQSPPDVLLGDKENWTEVRDTFNSRYGGEQFLIIGNFHLDDSSGVELLHTGDQSHIHAYYYIDDVSVIALDSLPNSVTEQEQLGLEMWPNPATETIYVRSSGLARLRLLDISGREAAAPVHSAIGAEENLRIDISGTSAGLYLLEATDKRGRRAVKKVVVH